MNLYEQKVALKSYILETNRIKEDLKVGSRFWKERKKERKKEIENERKKERKIERKKERFKGW